MDAVVVLSRAAFGSVALTLLWAVGMRVSLFWGHVVGMVCALLISSEAILVLYRRKASEHRKSDATHTDSSRSVHSALQLTALLCMLTGFVCIVVNKMTYNRLHFRTLHARVGLAVVMCSVAQGAAGAVAQTSCCRRLLLRCASVSAVGKALSLHRRAGGAVFAGAGLACVLAVWTSAWAQSILQTSARVMLVALITGAVAATVCCHRNAKQRAQRKPDDGAAGVGCADRGPPVELPATVGAMGPPAYVPLRPASAVASQS